MQAEKAIVI
jgi:solute carrier family 23 (nucleobase transporter), member 1